MGIGLLHLETADALLSSITENISLLKIIIYTDKGSVSRAFIHLLPNGGLWKKRFVRVMHVHQGTGRGCSLLKYVFYNML